MSDKLVTVLQGDALTRLSFLPSDSVHCVVTSPPYWMLRNYGVEGQIGLEPSFSAYLERIVAVFREVRRVLRKDGTCWVNLGDCYFGSGKGYNRGPCKQDTNKGSRRGTVATRGFGGRSKDLVGMPWRVAFALQDDGWFLRRDIIWHKTNPMPESVSDRPATAHEYIFLLTKSSRYYFDMEAVKEPVSGTANARGSGVNPKARYKTPDGSDTSRGNGGHGSIHRLGREKGKIPGANSRIHVTRDPKHALKAKRPRQNGSFSAAVAGLVSRRNLRSVWTFATAPFRGAHFATFPPKLVEPCILAGTSEGGCCARCGSPLRRIIEKGPADLAWQQACGGDGGGRYDGKATKDYAKAGAQDASATKVRILEGMRPAVTIGWKETCRCGVPCPVPCVVVDPFGGSGTTAMVAQSLGRRSIVIELNPDYIPLIYQRCGLSDGPS